MLWEKKTQLAREARDAVDSEVGHGEIHSMKAEIHRMEVRYAHLMRQQEKMVQDMEKSVFKRECIIVRCGSSTANVLKRFFIRIISRNSQHLVQLLTKKKSGMT